MEPRPGLMNPAKLHLKEKCWQALNIHGVSSRMAWFYPVNLALLTASSYSVDLAHSSTTEMGCLPSHFQLVISWILPSFVCSGMESPRSDHLIMNLLFSQEFSYLDSCHIHPVFSLLNSLFLEPCIYIMSSYGCF